MCFLLSSSETNGIHSNKVQWFHFPFSLFYSSLFMVNFLFLYSTQPTSLLNLASIGFIVSPFKYFSPFLCISFFPFLFSLSLPVELSSLSLCMTNSKLGEPCFYIIGRTENTRLVMVPVSSPIFCLSTVSTQSPLLTSVLRSLLSAKTIV